MARSTLTSEMQQFDVAFAFSGVRNSVVFVEDECRPLFGARRVKLQRDTAARYVAQAAVDKTGGRKKEQIDKI